MAEDLNEDDYEELIPVDTPPEDTHDDDDDDGEDERLADDADDDPDGDTNPNRKKRLKRRQVQKIAKENAQRELRLLREQNDNMAKRLAAVEGNALSHNEMALDTRINEAQLSVRQAEAIIARAIEAGNGDDVATALRMRDEALYRANQLVAAKEQVNHVRSQPAAPDPRVKSLAQEWVEANGWYRSDGSTEESAITNAIDARLVAEGFDPTTRKYWKELTKRVSARIGSERGAHDDTPSRKKAPPMGNTREHAPQSTKKEVYVTADRKQAMIEAGYWDDPVKRTQMLKAYQAHDRNSAR